MERKATAGMDEREPAKSVNVGSRERNVSLVGGAALVASGAAALAKRRIFSGLGLLVAGGMLAYRGKTGHCSLYQALGVSTAGDAVTMEKTVTVNRPRDEVYGYWRKIENLPRFMKHVETVISTGPNTSHWKAAGPGDLSLEWDAEITEDRFGEEIAWRSVDGADVENEGSVDFRDAPGGRGTEVHVSISYRPPGGVAGKAAAAVGNLAAAEILEEDLKRFKQILETGEIATPARM